MSSFLMKAPAVVFHFPDLEKIGRVIKVNQLGD